MKIGVTIKSNKGWYFEPIATACAVVIATLLCFLGEKMLERTLTGGGALTKTSTHSGMELD